MPEKFSDILQRARDWNGAQALDCTASYEWSLQVKCLHPALFGATGFGGVDNLSFWILNGAVFAVGCSIELSWAEVSKPATLLTPGLGTAGLPVARRLHRGVVL